MPKPAQLLCSTCGTWETHLPLTRGQEAHLRQELGVRNVDGYWMCVRVRADDTPCRNVRSFFTTKRFSPPRRMPDEVG